MSDVVGSVAGLWRYPVKSMQGEAVDEAVFGARGLVGDRAFAVCERETGLVGSAKHPRKWGALLHCKAEYVAPPDPAAPLPPLRITLPDGTVVRSDQADIDQILSELLGRAVFLNGTFAAAPMREANRAPADAIDTQELIRRETMAAASPAGALFDYAPIHLITTATLSHLQELYPAGSMAIARFRPNILVQTEATVRGFPENGWLGQHILVGGGTLDLIDPCPRCVVTTLPQGELPRDPGILRTVGAHNAVASITAYPGTILPAVAGIYARALQAGVIRCGDQLMPIEPT